MNTGGAGPQAAGAEREGAGGNDGLQAHLYQPRPHPVETQQESRWRRPGIPFGSVCYH